MLHASARFFDIFGSEVARKSLRSVLCFHLALGSIGLSERKSFGVNKITRVALWCLKLD